MHALKLALNKSMRASDDEQGIKLWPFIQRGSTALKVNDKFLVGETRANTGFRKETKPA